MKRRGFYFVPLLLLFYYGCGEPVILKPNYNNEEFSKKIDSLSYSPRIVKAIDKRGASTVYAGTAQVGLFNTLVPYYIDEPVSLFVQKAVNKIIAEDKEDSLYVPIEVAVEKFKVSEKTFSFSEEGYFDCKLKFSYSDIKDSVISFTAATHQVTSALDVTNSLEGLIYKGVKDCVQQFCKFYKNNISKDSLKLVQNSELISSNDTTNNEKVSFLSPKLKQKDKMGSGFFGIEYSQGNTIASGVNILYQQFYNLSIQQLSGGFGISASFYNVSNSDNLLDGMFWGITARYSLRYFLFEPDKGLYLALGLRFMGGNEKISDLYGNSHTNFFFGPTFEESAGFSISNRVLIEIGLYQIKLWGSELLPDDTGFLVGINFGM